MKHIEMSQGERERHERLLSELEEFRGKLLGNLLSWTAEDDVEKSQVKDTIDQLATVQGCINAGAGTRVSEIPRSGNCLSGAFSQGKPRHAETVLVRNRFETHSTLE